MPSLQGYSADLPYGYAPGVFPSLECFLNRPQCVQRLLIHTQSGQNEGVAKLTALAEEHHVRVEEADKALARISGKDNCYAAVVFEKFQDELPPEADHVVLHHPSDRGNAGTILRSALGFGYAGVAFIRPCVDVFDPHVIRASMGAVFSLMVKTYADFETYRAEHPSRALYPFMLDGSTPLDQAVSRAERPCSLIFGNEGSGLPPEFSTTGQAVRIPHSDKIDSLNLSIAAAIGMYAFAAPRKEAALC